MLNMNINIALYGGQQCSIYLWVQFKKLIDDFKKHKGD